MGFFFSILVLWNRIHFLLDGDVMILALLLEQFVWQIQNTYQILDFVLLLKLKKNLFNICNIIHSIYVDIVIWIFEVTLEHWLELFELSNR